MAVEVINTRYEVLEKFPSTESSPYAQYKARDVQEGRVVALKVVPSRLASAHPDLLPQLRAAVRTAAPLEHPMISRIYDAGQLENGDVYLVSDYVRGITLRERIRRIAPFSLTIASDIAVAIAEALTTAHRAGVIHGRLLPENVILSPEGQIRVGEFTAGRLIHDLLPNAESMSAAYRPPEAAFDEEPAPTDDIYALGAILYEMLTGVQPAESNGELPTSPRALNPGIPPALEGITLKALHPDTTIRYEDVAALLADLQAARAALRAGRALTWSPLANAKPSRSAASVEPRKSSSRATVQVEPEYDDEAANRVERESPGALAIAVRVMFVITLCGVLALGWFFTKYLSPPPDVTVPNLVGRTMDDAKTLAHEKHFVPVEVKHDYSTKWPEGQVYAQDPPAGRTIKAGKTVNLYVSDGPQFITVPDLVGMTEDKARHTLTDSILDAGNVDYDYSETVPKGVVIRQTPTAHSNESQHTKINFTISRGKQPPDTPLNVVANPVAPDKVQLTWQAAGRAVSYKVSRIVDGTITVVAPSIKETTFTDTGLQPNTSYSYTVTAVNAVGESAPSDPYLAITPPAPEGTQDGSTGSVTETSPSTSTSATPPSASPDNTPTGSSSTGSQQRQFRIEFRLPRHPRGDHRVRFEVTDSTGTTLVYDEMHHSGDFISVAVPGFGDKVVFRIYVDDALMKQQTL